MAWNKFRVASLLSFVNEKVFADTYTYMLAHSQVQEIVAI